MSTEYRVKSEPGTQVPGLRVEGGRSVTGSHGGGVAQVL